MRRILTIAALVLSAASMLSAQPAPPNEVVTALARALRERYVFPETGELAAKHLLQRLHDGAYDKIAPADFATTLAADMQSIAHDKHLQVSLGGGPMTGPRRDPRESNFGFAKLEHLPGNVGYLRLDAFADPAADADLVAGAMRFLANADAIVIDLRHNGGGNADAVTFLASYFFDKPQHLTDFYRRAGNVTQAQWTRESVDGKRMPDLPLFVVTSHFTFSAAEGFAYHLQAMHRATVVGEATGGGANPGEVVELGGGFTAFIPNGRTINPITKSNWEGAGVQPDVAAPADRAVDVAYQHALRAIAAKTADAQKKRALEWILEGLALEGEHYVAQPDVLAQYAGSYGPRNVSLRDGALWYARGNAPARRMIPLAPDVFSVDGIDGFRIRFARDGGKVATLVGSYEDGTVDQNARTVNG